ncbi:hypothetical protein QEH48_gp056 [Streptomyces phage TurkishDelight]|uniref:Uncharacterized protein n=1 Tax=Streptomyces phage TurkishDelight TaxID=2793708 RepID=A0A7T0M118_9CAUD|nr:hypothetical protein QEH48_gp056 [Streptomyces phage TurkishDelight]QPL14085.1 hypothetical protein SEA_TURKISHDELIGHT_56 [Streptomyces phage TurkishDelight]
MAANCSQPPDVIAPAVALTELFTTHPELTPEASGLTWTLTPSGVLHAEACDAEDGGRAVERCAKAMGATPLCTPHLSGRDRVVIARLAAVYRGVPVEVWETYRAPEEEPRRPLGALVVLAPVGGDR